MFSRSQSQSPSVLRRSNGADKVGFGNKTVQRRLDEIYVNSLDDLRAMTSADLVAGQSIVITDPGVHGAGSVKVGTRDQVVGLVEPFADNTGIYWERDNVSGRINVEWCGALSTNSAVDNTVAIQTAVDALGLYSVYGGTIYFPNVYSCNSINPYSKGITQNKYPSTIANGHVNKIKFVGDGYLKSGLSCVTGNAIEPIDPVDVIPATPGRLSFELHSMSLEGNKTNTDSVKYGRGFYADTAKVSISYLHFKDCLITNFGRGIDYLGYEGTGPLADGHTIVESCLLKANQIGVTTAVDNVTFLNCYITRNSEYGISIEEGRCVSIIGGKLQYNGQDNFGTNDNFSRTGQIRVGGTTQRDAGVGNISMRDIYLEPTFESGNAKHSFFDVHQLDSNTRTMNVGSLDICNMFVNGKDCDNFFRLDDNCVIENLEIHSSEIALFKLPDGALIKLGANARVLNGLLDTKNKFNSVGNTTGGAWAPDLVRLLDPVSSNPNFNYNVQNQLGIKAAQTIANSVANGTVVETAVHVSDIRSIYRVTVADIYLSGGVTQNISRNYVGLLVITPDSTKNEDIHNTSYSLSVSNGFLAIANSSGGSRQFSYVIERIL